VDEFSRADSSCPESGLSGTEYFHYLIVNAVGSCQSSRISINEDDDDSSSSKSDASEIIESITNFQPVPIPSWLNSISDLVKAAYAFIDVTTSSPMDVSALNDNLSTEDCIEITNGHVKPSQQSIADRNQNVIAYTPRHVLWMPESKKDDYNVELAAGSGAERRTSARRSNQDLGVKLEDHDSIGCISLEDLMDISRDFINVFDQYLKAHREFDRCGNVLHSDLLNTIALGSDDARRRLQIIEGSARMYGRLHPETMTISEELFRHLSCQCYKHVNRVFPGLYGISKARSAIGSFRAMNNIRSETIFENVRLHNMRKSMLLQQGADPFEIAAVDDIVLGGDATYLAKSIDHDFNRNSTYGYSTLHTMADNLATALADGDDAKVTDAVVAKQHSVFYATPLQMGLNGSFNVASYDITTDTANAMYQQYNQLEIVLNCAGLLLLVNTHDGAAGVTKVQSSLCNLFPIKGTTSRSNKPIAHRHLFYDDIVVLDTNDPQHISKCVANNIGNCDDISNRKLQLWNSQTKTFSELSWKRHIQV
jgi:hypothetical protein